MSTPLYDELVVKYYLSKGIKPFSYPHEPVGLNAVPKVVVSLDIDPKDVVSIPKSYVNLGYTDLTEPKTQSNGYFNL